MLTNAEALAEVRDGRVYPDRLSRKRHEHYLAAAEQLLALYRAGAGRTREELHEEVRAVFWSEQDCPLRRVRAFGKLLDDASEFEGAEGGSAARLRLRVFKMAAGKHPLLRRARSLIGHAEQEVKASIATELGRPWAEIERDLFGDIPSLHRLKSFPGYASAEALLSRYNEAQLQAVLYGATQMRIVARGDYKAILRAAKLARLMHTSQRLASGFEFTFDGPASALRTTKRYGIYMARIIPALLACRDWELSATIQRFPGARQPKLVLTSADGYRGSARPAAEFDSELERKFAEKWGTAPREGWTLRHESEPRFAGQKAFFPDFTFEHEHGARVLFEIIGHWTPEYLSAKHATLQTFAREPLLLAVREGVIEQFADLGLPIVSFKTVLQVEAVLTELRRWVQDTPEAAEGETYTPKSA